MYEKGEEMNPSEAYKYGCNLFKRGLGIADAMLDIKRNVKNVTGFERWAASDGYCLSRRGEATDHWKGR